MHLCLRRLHRFYKSKQVVKGLAGMDGVGFGGSDLLERGGQTGSGLQI